MPNTNLLVEVCCDHLESALIAAQLGAARIELCSALSLGGLSPSLETVKLIQSETAVPLMVLIRSRPGHFHYSTREQKLMLSEAEEMLKLGVQGIVCGALNDDSSIDQAFLKEMLDLCSEHDFTFHRAFDFAPNWKAALDDLQLLACPRLLSSGLAPTAEMGLPNLVAMKNYCSEALTIMPGSGINSSNFHLFKNELQAREIHLSAKRTIPSQDLDAPFATDYYSIDREELKTVLELANHE